MNPSGNFQQLPWIKKIIQDETWYEGERRGCEVNQNDPAIIERVTSIIITGAGKIFREKIEKDGQ